MLNPNEPRYVIIASWLGAMNGIGTMLKQEDRMASIELHLNDDVLNRVERLAQARGSTVEAVITELIEQGVQEQLGQEGLVTEPRLQHQLEALERIRQHKY